jgi:hypothetical protein
VSSWLVTAASSKERRRPGFRAWWRRLSIAQVFLLGLVFSLVVPRCGGILALMIAYWWSGGR